MWLVQILVVMVLWAACYPLIVLGLDDSPHLYFAFLRAVLAGSVLLTIALLLRRPWPHGTTIWLQLAGIGFGATSLAFLGMFHASEYIAPGLATVITNTQPILATALGYIFLHEHLVLRGRAGLVLGFVGIVLIAWPSGVNLIAENYTLGLAYLLLSAIGITFSNVLIRRVAGKVDALMAMGLQLLFGSLPLLILAGVMENPGSIKWTSSFLVSLLLLSLAGTALVYWLWCKVLETTELYRANVFTYLVPILGLVIGKVFYDERFGLLALLGVVLTFIAIALVNSLKPAQ